MKKNISINLFGQLYAIDEDAYLMLERYFESMKSYFSRQEGGEEIADDIEHRVAELLWERREAGATTVDIEAVKAIIKQIGNPSEIDNNEETSAEGGMGESVKKGFYEAGKATRSFMHKTRDRIYNRRFYRDGREAMLGGVCAGLAKYFGGQDPLLWRLAVLALTFFSAGFAIVFYLLVWFLTPKAETPEDLLRMKGKEVNSANLSEQILNEAEEEPIDNPRRSRTFSVARGCLWVLFLSFLGIFILPCLIMAVVAFCLMVAFIIVMFGGSSSLLFGTKSLILMDLFKNYWLLSTTTLICGILAGGIPVYAFICLLRNNPNKTLSTNTKVTLAIVWIISVVMGIFSLCALGYNIDMLT